VERARSQRPPPDRYDQTTHQTTPHTSIITEDNMLSIRDLKARVEEQEKDILKGLNLQVGRGEVHAIMGPNGSGKSTLAHLLAGRDGYEVTGGSVEFDGTDLLALAPEERAREGLFLAFQYPVEIPGVNNVYLLKAALNAVRKHRGEPELDAYEFLTLVREKMALMQMDESFLQRGVNQGFSGGEKKRNEILQMAVLEPKLAVLDETDSGLDIDALKIVANGVNSLRNADRSILLVTHYQRLLDYIVPDHVHVLAGGRIIKSGDKSLARELEARGYDWVLEEANAA
jgi:Fe-S cluster assembly ATP-binding protein